LDLESDHYIRSVTKVDSDYSLEKQEEGASAPLSFFNLF